VTGRQLLSLSVYTGVIVLSGALAFFYLFVDERIGLHR
jgi:hypothetical protein